MTPEKLRTWIKKHPNRIVTYRLQYGEVDGGEEQLGEWDAVESTEILGLCTTIVECAQQHCDEMGQGCRYKCAGFDKEGKSVLVSTLRQQPEGAVAFEGMRNLEDASSAGVTAQAIRHTEAMTQMLVRAFGQILNVQASQVDQLQRTVAMFQKREGDMMELARSMATQSEDAVSKERNADRWDKLAEILGDKVGPAVLKEMGLLPETFGGAAEVVKLATGVGGEGGEPE